MEHAIAIPRQVTATPYDMISSALSSGADLDKLEKLMLLQERWEKNEAKKAYVSAMAGFKANPPKIIKDSHVKFQTSKGLTEYDHASLANVTATVNGELSKYGLSASWYTSQADGAITVSCTITHCLGHCESTSLSARPDDSGGKNAIQAVGSTISYLQRYTLLSLTGLATHDMDNDAQTQPVPTLITQAQAESLRKLLKETGTDETKWLRFCKVESIDSIQAVHFDSALKTLNDKKAAIEAKRREPGQEG